jgi:hypothetical protein
VAQRYVVVAQKDQKPGNWQGINAPLRVSDDGKMAIKHINGVPKDSPDFQDFYATDDVLGGSAAALEATGSAFLIAPGAESITGRPPNVKGAPAQTLTKAAITNQDFEPQGKGNYTFNVCSGNMSNFLGILRSLPDGENKWANRRDIVLKLQGSLDHDNQSVGSSSNSSASPSPTARGASPSRSSDPAPTA